MAWVDYVANPNGDIWGHRYDDKGNSLGMFQINDVDDVANPFPFEFPFGPSIAALPATEATDGDNSFIIPEADLSLGHEERDRHDLNGFYEVLQNKVLPAYYEDKAEWDRIVFNSMNDVAPFFDSDRMADEYYQKVYR